MYKIKDVLFIFFFEVYDTLCELFNAEQATFLSSSVWGELYFFYYFRLYPYFTLEETFDFHSETWNLFQNKRATS